jgi:hypothetical protein
MTGRPKCIVKVVVFFRGKSTLINSVFLNKIGGSHPISMRREEHSLRSPSKEKHRSKSMGSTAEGDLSRSHCLLEVSAANLKRV